MAFPTMGAITEKFVGQPYDLNSVLGPAEVWAKLDAPPEQVRVALNVIINALNSVVDGSSGADNLGMTPISSIGSQATAQSIIDALVARLQATTTASGAKFIGTETIVGLTGNDVQTLLAALKTLSDAYNTSQTGALNTHKTSSDHDSRYATASQGTLATNALPATSYTAADVLTKIKTVDGAGSGLDADLLDGLSSTSAATISTVMTRDAAGRAKVVAPSSSDDIALKSTVTDDIATHNNVASSETVKGHVELATAAETTTGTSTTLAVHPAGLKVETDKKINHSLATAANDFLVASGAGVFVKKTTNEVRTTILSIPVGFGPGTGLLSTKEGDATTASGDYSHAEGFSTTASGDYSHSEGFSTTASGDYSHSEGYATLACNGTLYNITDFDNTSKTIALDNVTGLIVGDLLTIKILNTRPIEDIPITAINGLWVTLNTISTITSSWDYAIKKVTTMYPVHAEGNSTLASGRESHAEGYNTTASGKHSHAEGNSSTASGDYSHSEGFSTTASQYYSHAEGSSTLASGVNSHAQNKYTVSQGYIQTVIGEYNVVQGTTTSKVTTDNAFIIGNGTSDVARANAFRVTWEGAAYGLSAYNSTGADYSEFFEWLDGNLNNEDRVGYFVALDGEKIRKATSIDNYIIGIVSATPAIVGDSYNDDWQGRYVTDVWGRRLTHEVLVPAVTQVIDIIADDGTVSQGTIIVSPEHIDTVFVQNPDWDTSLEYIPRENRPEWATIGMLGKLLVRDDGTCVVNGYCKSNDSGIATLSPSGFKVIKRIAPNIIQVIIK